MLTILKELWPFFKEFILKNKELRDDVKDPKTTLIIIFSITAISVAIYFIYSMFIVLISNSHNRSVLLSEDILRLEESFRELTDNGRDLTNRLHKLQMKKNALELDMLAKDKLIKRHEITNLFIGEELEKCLTEGLSVTPTDAYYDYDTNTLFIELHGE